MQTRRVIVTVSCLLASTGATLGQGADVPGELYVTTGSGVLRSHIADLSDPVIVSRQVANDLSPSDRPWNMFCLWRASSSDLWHLQRRRQRDGMVTSDLALPLGADAIAYDRVNHRVIVSKALTLYAVEPDTGATTDLGRAIRATAMAYHEGSGLLYAVSTFPQALWGWDEAARAWTNIAPMATPAETLAYNPADGQLYLTAPSLSGGTTDSLFRVDPGTGQRTEIGRFPDGVVRLSSGLVFTTEPHCYGDCDGDGELTVFDLLCYMNLFQDGDDLADCNQDGTLNVFDFICFQSHFSAGCD